MKMTIEECTKMIEHLLRMIADECGTFPGVCPVNFVVLTIPSRKKRRNNSQSISRWTDELSMNPSEMMRWVISKDHARWSGTRRELSIEECLRAMEDQPLEEVSMRLN